MTSEGYSIVIPTVSSGGSISMEAGGYKIMDIKGQTAVGTMGSTSYGVELGGVYGETAGAGIIEGDWPYGTVPLNIRREVNNIILTWEARFVNPEIYILTGDGVGRYASGEGWIKVTQGGARYTTGVPTEWDYDVFPAMFSHIDQVGMGTSEAYYKGLQAGVSPTTANPRVTGKTYLQSAWAVGKVNVAITGGKKWTLFCVPFMDIPADVNEILAGQANYGGGADATSSVRIFSHFNGGWNKSSYFNGTSWVPTGLPAAEYDGNKGLYLLTRTGDPDKIFTLVGKVKPLNAATDYVINPGWNVIGMPYPVLMGINNIDLTVGQRNDDWQFADRIFGRKNNGYNTCVYLRVDGTWAEVPGLGGYMTYMTSSTPMYYQSRSGSDRPWSINPRSRGYY